MKAVGIVLIVLFSLFLGCEKRSEKIRDEKISYCLSDFFNDLAGRVSYSGEPLTLLFERMISSTQYSKLSFFSEALERVKGENCSLSVSLASSLKGSELNKSLNSEERESLDYLFSDFGEVGKERELEKIKNAAENLLRNAEKKREENTRKKGYYEIMYTLAGTTIAILLA